VPPTACCSVRIIRSRESLAKGVSRSLLCILNGFTSVLATFRFGPREIAHPQHFRNRSTVISTVRRRHSAASVGLPSAFCWSIMSLNDQTFPFVEVLTGAFHLILDMHHMRRDYRSSSRLFIRRLPSATTQGYRRCLVRQSARRTFPCTVGRSARRPRNGRMVRDSSGTSDSCARA
jgi:hypothetical protein